jgi:transcriptional regulator with XRE-family HTH domain
MTFAEALEARRQELGLTQLQVAEALGAKTPRTYARIVSGVGGLPEVGTLVALAGVLRVRFFVGPLGVEVICGR